MVTRAPSKMSEIYGSPAPPNKPERKIYPRVAVPKYQARSNVPCSGPRQPLLCSHRISNHPLFSKRSRLLAPHSYDLREGHNGIKSALCILRGRQHRVDGRQNTHFNLPPSFDVHEGHKRTNVCIREGVAIRWSMFRHL